MNTTLKKLHIAQTVEFAIKNIPQIDTNTLEKLIELVNANGSFGTMTKEGIAQRMSLVLKYIPGTCPHSLLVLADLLDIQFANPETTQHFLPQNMPLNVLASLEGMQVNHANTMAM